MAKRFEAHSRSTGNTPLVKPSRSSQGTGATTLSSILLEGIDA